MPAYLPVAATCLGLLFHTAPVAGGLSLTSRGRLRCDIFLVDIREDGLMRTSPFGQALFLLFVLGLQFLLVTYARLLVLGVPQVSQVLFQFLKPLGYFDVM